MCACVCEMRENSGRKKGKGENIELFYGMVSVDMKAVVRDLFSLFAEQQSIPLPVAVLICPTCLDTHTHTIRSTQIQRHISKQAALLSFLSLSHSLSHTSSYRNIR